MQRSESKPLPIERNVINVKLLIILHLIVFDMILCETCYWRSFYSKTYLDLFIGFTIY